MGSSNGRIGANNAIAITNTSQPSASHAPTPKGFFLLRAAVPPGTATTAAISCVAASTGSPSWASSAASSSAELGSGSGMANPRIEDRVEDVDSEVDQHVEDRNDRDVTLDRDILLGPDGLEQRVAHARQLEDDFDHNGAADERSDIQPCDREECQARWPQGVTEEDASVGDALRLGCSDEVLSQGRDD